MVAVFVAWCWALNFGGYTALIPLSVGASPPPLVVWMVATQAWLGDALMLGRRLIG